MMRSFLLAIGFLLIAGFPLHAEDTFFVRDIWTDQPIPQAQVTISDSVVFTDDYGVFRTDISLTDSMRINIAKTGYFDIAFTLSMLNSPVIYLTPVENTASIICIRPQITDTPLQLPSSTSYILIDQTDQISNKNIADVLAGQTGIFMKSYGPGGSLQSISVRGMSPEQTQILFDGIPMNSLQLGTVDMGLYGLNNIGSLEIYRGGNALFGGSGSIGGSIDINPAPLFKEFNYKISGSVNSLSGFNFDGSIDLPFRNYRQRIFFSRAKAENKFKTKYNGKEVSLKNRDYQQISYGYQNAYNFTRDFYIKGYFSGYQREGGSPGPFINPEKEKDNSARSEIKNYLGKIKLEYNPGRFGMSFQGYYRNEQMLYKDTSLVIDFKPTYSDHKNNETGLQLRLHYPFFNKVLLNAGFEGAGQKINSTESGEHSRQREAAYMLADYNIYSNYSAFVQSINLNGALRYEYFSNYGNILLPGFGLNLRGKFWQIYLTGSKNYRIPTFNELYWSDGQARGNQQLKPERSFNIETGVEFNKYVGRTFKCVIQAALYKNRVKDQIRWLPEDNTTWSPENVIEVLSKGIELNASINDLTYIHKLSANYRYGISEKYKAEIEDDETVGNQLPLLPREQYNINAQTGWRLLRMGINYSHVSFRYKTIDNKADQILPSYQTVDTWAGFEFKLNKNNIRIFLAAENLFNEDFQLVDGYPMPWRNYTLTLSSEL